MSAHGGIYYFDGKAVEPDSVSILRRSLEAAGPDRCAVHRDGSLALAASAFYTNRESRLERQPLISLHGHILTWDGRLDNRDELLALLGQNLEDEETDAGLALSAYMREGLASFAGLIGDWALSLWEPKSRTVLLARDFPGNRPLYYRVVKNAVVWSSELETFLDLADEPLRLNDAFLLQFLVNYTEVTDTPYEGVKAVPPGHVVMFRDGAVEIRKFWEPDLTAEIRYKADSEYEERFREIFRASVRGRLRAEGVVWAELSGGFDSSSIVCEADRLYLKESVESERLETFSDIYGQSASTDESQYIAHVERQRGRRGFHLEETEYQLFLPDGDLPYLSRPQPNLGRSLRLARLMAQDGARVLLSGQGGDSVMWSMERPCLDLADFLAQRKFRQLHRLIKAYSLHTGRTYWNLFWMDAVGPHTPRPSEVIEHRMAVDPWINWEMFRRFEQQRSDDGPTVVNREVPISRRVSYKMILNAMRILSLHHFRTCGNVEASYPYLDRRLIQFMLSIPFDQKLRPGSNRSLHRRAMKDVLPEEIQKRQGKTGAEECLCRALRREWSSVQPLFGKGARVVERGYADGPQLSAVLDKAVDGRHPDLYSVMRVIALEVWLRGLETRRRTLADKPTAEVEPEGEPVFHS